MCELDWIKVEYELPDYFNEILIYYSDKDGSNEGICVGSYQPDVEKDYWLAGELLKGECYSDEESIVRAWFPYQEYLSYPKL